jgi:hypothetical protein
MRYLIDHRDLQGFGGIYKVFYKLIEILIDVTIKIFQSQWIYIDNHWIVIVCKAMLSATHMD